MEVSPRDFFENPGGTAVFPNITKTYKLYVNP